MRDAATIRKQLEGRPDSLGTDEHKGLLQARFRGFVKQSRIVTAGEVNITIAVPFEGKYDALPITDLRAMLFTFEVYAPPGMDTSDIEASIERALTDGAMTVGGDALNDSDPDSNPFALDYEDWTE